MYGNQHNQSPPKTSKAWKGKIGKHDNIRCWECYSDNVANVCHHCGRYICAEHTYVRGRDPEFNKIPGLETTAHCREHHHPFINPAIPIVLGIITLLIWMILWNDSNGLYINVMTPAGGKESGWYVPLTPTLNARNHVVFTIDATIRIKSYLNGALVEDKNWAQTYTPTDYNLMIGGRDSDAMTTFDNCKMDEVRLYNRILDAPEILKHYQIIK